MSAAALRQVSRGSLGSSRTFERRELCFATAVAFGAVEVNHEREDASRRAAERERFAVVDVLPEAVAGEVLAATEALRTRRTHRGASDGSSLHGC